jgi:hypothetical protein
MTTRQYIRLGVGLAAVAAAFFLGDIKGYRSLAGAMFVVLGALAVYQAVKVRHTLSRPDRRVVATQVAWAAVASFLLAGDYFWSGRYLSTLAMLVLCCPSVVSMLKRRPTEPSGSWMW